MANRQEITPEQVHEAVADFKAKEKKRSPFIEKRTEKPARLTKKQLRNQVAALQQELEHTTELWDQATHTAAVNANEVAQHMARERALARIAGAGKMADAFYDAMLNPHAVVVVEHDRDQSAGKRYAVYVSVVLPMNSADSFHGAVKKAIAVRNNEPDTP